MAIERLPGTKALITVVVAGMALGGLLLARQTFASGQRSLAERHFPWLDSALDPDQRASLVMRRMTLSEKINLVHGAGLWGFTPTEASILRSAGGAGFVPGIPRLGIPDLNMSDSAVGVADTTGKGRYATALPSALALASSWDEELAYQYGSLIGAELTDFGFNVSLGGGVNLARDPRGGRTFEMLGEDPILAGNELARMIEGVQSHHVIGDVKHLAVNDQETGRRFADVVIGERALRETDLLAFEIAVKKAHPGMVMCAYNMVNGVYSCQSPHLLDEVLKKDWGFKGWIISDWFAGHSTVKAALAGLDMQMPDGGYFGGRLRQSVEDGRVPMARLNDMVHRILRTEFALGIVDHPPVPEVPDIFKGFRLAQRVEEESAVLLENSGVLPLDPAKLSSIAVIGSHANVGVLSGGGSAQVDAPGGNAIRIAMPPPSDVLARRSIAVWDPSSPLRSIRSRAPHARVIYNAGVDVSAAAAAAKDVQVAIVFVHQHTRENVDVPSLKLPGDQDQLVEAVAAVNPHTIVVLETGGPVAMPWAGKVQGILEAWYPGIRGGQAIANLLFGIVNPSGKLPITFPRSAAQLPHPDIPAPAGSRVGVLPAIGDIEPPFEVRYTEGLKVGYKWFDAEHEQPLFPFGFGLSYTSFRYSRIEAKMHGGKLLVTFALRNAGARLGTETAEVYLGFPPGAGEPPKRLIGWARVPLQPEQGKVVTIRIEPWYLSIFDTRQNQWRIFPGQYTVFVGPSSRNPPISATLRLP